MSQKIIETLGLDPKKFKMYHTAWWVNPRRKTTGGFRLTENGYKAFKALDIEEFVINLDEKVEWNSKVILQMDHFVDAPFYISQDKIHVFESNMAVQLILFNGNIQRYGNARQKSVAKKQQEKQQKNP